MENKYEYDIYAQLSYRFAGEDIQRFGVRIGTHSTAHTAPNFYVTRGEVNGANSILWLIPIRRAPNRRQ